MKLSILSYLALLLFPMATSALHFYLDSNEVKCFIEELPKDTLVEGHYSTFEWSDESQDFVVNEKLGIQVVVSEITTRDVVVNTRGQSDGRFTFTSHEAGDHKICLQTNSSSSWFAGSHVKMYLDLAVGSVKHDHENDKAHLSDLASKVVDLNKKVNDIRRVQQFQREAESQFRDLSESTNSRAVYWSVLQLAVIFGTCVWQTRTLRKFFSEKRLR